MPNVNHRIGSPDPVRSNARLAWFHVCLAEGITAQNRAEMHRVGEKARRTKSFDVRAERLLWKVSRGDKTAIELFLAAVRELDATICARLGR